MSGVLVGYEGCVGIGMTEEDARREWHRQKCRVDLTSNSESIYRKRREMLKPWLADKDTLHIATVGCLLHKDGNFMETRSDRYYVPSKEGRSLFPVMAELFCEKLSYTDITIAIQKEFDEFAETHGFVRLSEHPVIQVLQRGVDFAPACLYVLKGGLTVAQSDGFVGLKDFSVDAYYGVRRDSGLSFVDCVTYLAYRLGYAVNAEGVVPIGKEDS